MVYPLAPSIIDDQGMLPIHFACRNGASRRVVMTLLNAFPKSINVKDKKGHTPLNLVENSNSQNKDAVIDEMQSFCISLDNNSLPLAGTGLRAVSPAMSPTMSPSVASGGNGLGLATTRKNSITIGKREVEYENGTILF